MRIGVIPEGIIERIVSAIGLLPTPLVIGSWGMAASRCIITGTKLGVFEALASGAKTAQEVAEVTQCHPESMKALLSALNGFGYLKRRGEYYSNSKVTKRWLLKSSRFSQRDAVLFYQDLWELMSEMDERIRTGKQADLHHSGRPSEFWERYMRGLASFARLTSLEIVRKVKLTSSPKRLLDVGGGHGVYSMAFCRKHPGLIADVLDLPEAVVFGRQIVKEQGMEERVCFIEGDLRETDWSESYDIILIFNVIHNVTPDEARQALGKAYRSLNSGGTLAILDSEYTGGEGDISTAGGFGELMFFLTSGTRSYPEQTIRNWVAAAGFTDLRSAYLLAVPAAFLLTARR